MQNVFSKKLHLMKTFVFSYHLQNENITKLKINNNPFAKGFRETGQSRCKRKYHQIGHDSQPDDEEGNSFSDSSESNRSASLDDLAQKSEIKSEIKNSDDYDDIKPSIPIAGEQRSPLKSDHESEVSSPFHRPWLDSPSHKPTAPMMPMVPSVSSLPAIHDLSWSYYFRSLQVPFIAQQNLARYYQYQCPMFHFRKLWFVLIFLAMIFLAIFLAMLLQL